MFGFGLVGGCESSDGCSNRAIKSAIFPEDLRLICLLGSGEVDFCLSIGATGSGLSSSGAGGMGRWDVCGDGGGFCALGS